MIQQQVMRELFVSNEPRPTRANLPSIPALLLTLPSADLEGDLNGLRTVAQVLTMLIDGASQFTDGDKELVYRLWQSVDDL